MSRGNQRDKAREKNQKAEAATRSKNTQTGREFARTKESQAAIMREKQAAANAKKTPKQDGGQSDKPTGSS